MLVVKWDVYTHCLASLSDITSSENAKFHYPTTLPFPILQNSKSHLSLSLSPPYHTGTSIFPLSTPNLDSHCLALPIITNSDETNLCLIRKCPKLSLHCLQPWCWKDFFIFFLLLSTPDFATRFLPLFFHFIFWNFYLHMCLFFPPKKIDIYILM